MTVGRALRTRRRAVGGQQLCGAQGIPLDVRRERKLTEAEDGLIGLLVLLVEETCAVDRVWA